MLSTRTLFGANKMNRISTLTFLLISCGSGQALDVGSSLPPPAPAITAPGTYQEAVTRAGDDELGDLYVVGPLKGVVVVELSDRYQRTTGEWKTDSWCSSTVFNYATVATPEAALIAPCGMESAGPVLVPDGEYLAIRMDYGVCPRTHRYPSSVESEAGVPDEFWCSRKKGDCTPMFLGGRSPQCAGQACQWFSRLHLGSK